MRPDLTPRQWQHFGSPGPLVVCLAAFLAPGCDDPQTTPGPGATTGVDTVSSNLHADAGNSTSRVTNSDDDAAPAEREAAASPVTLTSDAHSHLGEDATTVAHADDASPSAHDGASSSSSADAHASCDVEACNARGTCIRRDYWTECACDPSPLPACELPSFRVLGASRTNQEHIMYLMSGDGRVVAGTHAFDEAMLLSVGVTWTATDGLRMLEQHPDGRTRPTGINYDGSLIRGSVVASDGSDIEVVWRDGVLELAPADAGPWSSGNQPVTIPRDVAFEVFDSTPDGAMAVGKARRGGEDDAFRPEAAVWLRDKGVRFLRDVLTDQGVNLSRWELWHINAVSDDGLTMMGFGIGPDVGYRWYLQLPEGSWD